MDPGKISDTKGAEPDITIHDCKKRCIRDASCKFMLFGINIWSSNANRCALFQTCDYRSVYGVGNPIVFKRPYRGKKSNLGSNRTMGMIMFSTRRIIICTYFSYLYVLQHSIGILCAVLVILVVLKVRQERGRSRYLNARNYVSKKLIAQESTMARVQGSKSVI